MEVMMVTGNCPACGASVPIDDLIGISKRMRCPVCGALLEYTGRSPFLLQWIEEGRGADYPFEASISGTQPLRNNTRRKEDNTNSKRRQKS
jgi:DNA-directed RNA polymerase subunit RPC12/RpoP